MICHIFVSLIVGTYYVPIIPVSSWDMVYLSLGKETVDS